MKKKIKIIKEGSSKMWWNKHINEIFEVESEFYIDSILMQVRVKFEDRYFSIGEKCIEFLND